jgi:hypothetical protein
MEEMNDADMKAFLTERKRMSLEAYERIMVLCQRMKRQMKRLRKKQDL